MDRLKSYMQEKSPLVDKAMENYLPRLKEEPRTLHEAMRYSIFAGGKRLRPLLCMMGGEVFGVPEELCISAACSIEMIHTYSLIHDDLPAMDNDDYRRGKLSCHKAFGEAVAILAGDALLTLAFETITNHKPAAQANELVRVLAIAAGQAGMVGGQVLDIEAEAFAEEEAKKSKSRRLTTKMKRSTDIVDLTPMEKVENIHRRKTGALITAAVEMGAVIGKANKKERQALVDYGKKIGLAFQVKDDILDIEAPQEKLGKSTGKDEAAQKLTYPSIMGLEGAKMLLRDTIIDAKKVVDDFGEKAMMLRLLADFIAERDH